MIDIIGWLLIACFCFTFVFSAWRLSTGRGRPAVELASAVVSMAVLALAITNWNTVIPVWIWWLLCLLCALIAGLAVFRLAGARFEN